MHILAALTHLVAYLATTATMVQAAIEPTCGSHTAAACCNQGTAPVPGKGSVTLGCHPFDPDSPECQPEDNLYCCEALVDDFGEACVHAF